MGGIKGARAIAKVCRYQLSLQLHDLRTKGILLVVFFYLGGMISPLKSFGQTIGQGVSPWVFPILMNDTVCSMIVFLFWCFLVCDIPFRNEGYLYYAGRAGKRKWICGEILFLFVFSGIYVVSINLILWIHSLTRLTFTLEWGKTLGTLAYTDAVFQFPMPFSFPVTLMSSMSPLSATVFSGILVWLAAFLLGLSIFIVNWGLKCSAGIAFGMFWVFLDLTVSNLLDFKWWRYSPVSLTKLSMIMGSYRFLTPLWAILFLAGGTLVFILAILVITRLRKGIE